MIGSFTFDGIVEIILAMTDDIEKQQDLMYIAIKNRIRFGVYAVPVPNNAELVSVCLN